MTYITIEDWSLADNEGNVVTLCKGVKLRVQKICNYTMTCRIKPHSWYGFIDDVSLNRLNANSIPWKPKPKDKKIYTPPKVNLAKVTIPFGQYKNMTLNVIDILYLDWLVGQEWMIDKYSTLWMQIDDYLKMPGVARELEQALRNKDE